MLCAHATEFAEQNGWWSWISEQGMEHLHSLYNYLVSFNFFKFLIFFEFRLSNIATLAIRIEQQRNWPNIKLSLMALMIEGR